jgi:hypothetical protein
MKDKVTPNQIIELINSLPDSEKHIMIKNGKYWVTQEWLCGAFAGRAFVNEKLEDAVQEMIDYLYKHIGHNSMVGNFVTKSGFPNLERVKQYCTPVESESEEYKEWEKMLSDNPPEPYEQSEPYNKYWLRKWNHYEKLAKKFLKSKGKKHF